MVILGLTHTSGCLAAWSAITLLEVGPRVTPTTNVSRSEYTVLWWSFRSSGGDMANWATMSPQKKGWWISQQLDMHSVGLWDAHLGGVDPARHVKYEWFIPTYLDLYRFDECFFVVPACFTTIISWLPLARSDAGSIMPHGMLMILHVGICGCQWWWQ